MKELLANIQSGSFVKDWIKENEDGLPRMSKFRQENEEHPVEKVGKELRGMMAFIKRKD
jgi:ketol-acid reductoisomerase